MSEGTVTHGSRTWRYSKPVLLGIVVTLVILLILRISAAYTLQWYVNRKLDESPQYAGHVGDIDLMVLRGAYSIEDVEIVKTEGEVPVPLFAASAIEFSVLWTALFNGAVVGEVEMFDPQINIVDSNDESRKQTGEGGQWLAMFDDLFPLKMDRTVIHNGQVHFRNFDSEPKIDIFLSEIEGNAQNLANAQATTDSRIAEIELSARAMDVSDLTLAAAFDPTTEKPTFDVNMQLLQLPIMQLDNFINEYAPFDVEAGSVDVASELAARDGLLQGYVKPIIYNLEVFKWSEDIGEDNDNPLVALWEGLVDVVAELLENQPRDQIASYIPLQGDINAPDTNLFVAVAGIFKNAFVEAYQANIENTVALFTPNEGVELELPAPLGEVGGNDVEQGDSGQAVDESAGEEPAAMASDQSTDAAAADAEVSEAAAKEDEGAVVTRP
ncbi:MAG: hypothetical protein RLZZ227_164 [Pseudomonadota bacterium]